MKKLLGLILLVTIGALLYDRRHLVEFKSIISVSNNSLNIFSPISRPAGPGEQPASPIKVQLQPHSG